MTLRQFLKTVGSCAALAVVVLAGMLIRSPRVQAQEDETPDSNQLRIEEGFEIAPVPLNLEGKNRKLVGLGSYIVNAQGDCNGCHSAGPQTEFLKGGNPYFDDQPTKINPATYLGGGRDFGPFPAPGFRHIFSRNLTPDKTGRPEGGHTFSEFLQIIRTGVDMDHLHPNLPPPFDSDRLQIMPWPIYRNMTDHDIRAIYEYLSAIPCVTGPPAPSPLHNDCE